MKKSHIRKLLKAGADMLSSLPRPSSMLNFNIMDNFFFIFEVSFTQLFHEFSVDQI